MSIRGRDNARACINGNAAIRSAVRIHGRTVQGLLRCVTARVPEDDRPVGAAAGKHRTVVAEGQRGHGPGVAAQNF
jgi:hypothetical protein